MLPDVLVVGAGILGVSVAYHLSEIGKAQRIFIVSIAAAASRWIAGDIDIEQPAFVINCKRVATQDEIGQIVCVAIAGCDCGWI